MVDDDCSTPTRENHGTTAGYPIIVLKSTRFSFIQVQVSTKMRRYVDGKMGWMPSVEGASDAAKSPCGMHSNFVSYEAVDSTCR